MTAAMKRQTGKRCWNENGHTKHPGEGWKAEFQSQLVISRRWGRAMSTYERQPEFHGNGPG
jgi:hypothetical protein